MTHDIKATVEELERLERDATQGPWAPDLSAPYPGGDHGCSGVECLEEHSYPLWKEAVAKSWTQTICTTPHDSRYNKGEQARTNMEFIAAARNALPSLLAELRRSWANEARYREAVTPIIDALKNMIERTHHCGEEMPWDGRGGPDPLDVAKELIERLTGEKP